MRSCRCCFCSSRHPQRWSDGLSGHNKGPALEVVQSRKSSHPKYSGVIMKVAGAAPSLGCALAPDSTDTACQRPFGGSRIGEYPAHCVPLCLRHWFEPCSNPPEQGSFRVSYPLSLLSRLSNDQLRATAEAYRSKARSAPLPEIRNALILVAERFERVIAQRESQRQQCLPAISDTPTDLERIVVRNDPV